MSNENKTKTTEELLEALSEVSIQFQQAMAQLAKEQENYWQSLTKEQQLDAFCCVVRRICQAELVDKGSYRHALYSVFGFGPEAYAAAQDAGYLQLHNCIWPEDYEERMLLKFCEKNGFSKEQAHQMIVKFKSIV